MLLTIIGHCYFWQFKFKDMKLVDSCATSSNVLRNICLVISISRIADKSLSICINEKINTENVCLYVLQSQTIGWEFSDIADVGFKQIER